MQEVSWMRRCWVYVLNLGIDQAVAVELNVVTIASRQTTEARLSRLLFLESFIGDIVRFCGSAKFGQFGLYGVRFADWRQDTDCGFAGAQLCTETITICLVQAQALVVKRA